MPGAATVNSLSLLPRYLSGTPADNRYTAKPADTTPGLTPEMVAATNASYQDALPFTDASGYTWRNRAAYEASMAQRASTRAMQSDPAYLAARETQNRINMGLNPNPDAKIGIAGTEVSATPQQMATIAAGQQQTAANPRGSFGVGTGTPNAATLPQRANVFNAVRRPELPYYNRR